MKIQVLGSGCPTCHKLFELTSQAVKELHLPEKVEYLTGDKAVQKIISMGVMQSPVIAIDDKAVIAGSVPTVSRIKEIIRKNL
jgi:small redox-active disulfide protein 2